MKQLLICDGGQVDNIAPLCRELSCGIEVQAFHDPALLEQSPGALEGHRRSLQGVAPVSVLGCFGDLCPGSFDALVRDVARRRVEQGHGVAVGLGASHLVLHHGYVPGTSPAASWVRRSSAFWREFLSGKAPGVSVHLENMLELDPELIADVVDAIGHPNRLAWSAWFFAVRY